MATMIPSGIDSFKTEGEKNFYRFLQLCAKPDDKHIAWYLPDIEGREPDFILYSEGVGIIIFEVKDWVIDQIIEANPKYFMLHIHGRQEKHQNPFHQAGEYSYLIMDKIKKDGSLLSRDPLFRGKVRIPIHRGVVLSNINKYEYQLKGYDEVIPLNNIFFWDDLHPSSPICSDKSGGCFRSSLKAMFPPRFEFMINGREMNHLRQIIFPIIRSELPRRGNGNGYEKDAKRIKILDHHQESVARQYEGGHRIISGPSGSGKTLILVHRAALLKRYNPSMRNILFVCYNITLVNYIRRLLSDKNVSLGENGIEVLHFFELCSKITGENIPYEKEDTEFYDLVIMDTLEKLNSCSIKYDAILIDEGQDFSDNMVKIVMSLLNPQTNHLAIALDDSQDIYQRQRNWKNLGIYVRGRVHKITWIYRNTKEIADFANSILTDQSTPSAESTEQQTRLFPETFEMSRGPKPEIKHCHSYEHIGIYIADRIMNLTQHEGLD